MSDEQKPAAPPQQPNVAVVFQMSDERRKQKKDACKQRRELIRDRLRERIAK